MADLNKVVDLFTEEDEHMNTQNSDNSNDMSVFEDMGIQIDEDNVIVVSDENSTNNESKTEIVHHETKTQSEVLNRELEREYHYDCNELNTFVTSNLTKLNDQQQHVYDTIMNNVSHGTGGLFFLDAPGGTGKTFLISLILATIRSDNNVALALASSGIAATLLEGGRTAHSALKLPLNMQVNETPTCNISKTSGMAKVLKVCKLIVWDECTMAHKKPLEALDRTLKDLRGSQTVFGGAMILLAGDFRQTLPVIPKSTAADEINACLKSSYLWRHVNTLTLATNVLYVFNYRTIRQQLNFHTNY